MHVDAKLLDHQLQLLRSKSAKTLLLCGRGAGKSYIMAFMILLYLLQGKSVIATGQRYQTTHDTLFAEIKRMAQSWGIYDRIEWHESPMQMSFGSHHVFFGSYDAVESLRGYTNISLIAADELFLAPMELFSIVAPCMRGPEVEHPRIIAATTPRQGSLWNVAMASPDCDWEIIHATTRDNKFISDEQFQLICSEIHDSTMYDQEILGKLITDLGAAAILHLDDFPRFAGPTSDTRVIAGLDCAEGVERDATAFFKRKGNTVLEMWKLNTIDHEETVRRIRASHRDCPIDVLNLDAAFSDYEYTTLKYEIGCEQVNFARAASEGEGRDKYANVRAEMYFNLAHAIKHGLCVDGFDESPELKRQLCSIGWLHNNQGKLLLTKKEDLRAALGMSPDIADAAALTCLERYAGDEPNVNRDVRTRDKLDEWASMMG